MTCSTSSWTIDLVGDHEVVVHRVRARAEEEDLGLVQHDSYRALVASIASDPAKTERRVLVCAEDIDEIPEGFVRACAREQGRTRVVLLAPSLTERQARDFVLEGATAVHGLPLPVSPIRDWFSLDTFLQTVYPGALECERTEMHRLRIPSAREWVAPTIRHLCQRFDRLGYPDELVRSVLPLVIDEAVTNAMAHGHGWNASELVDVEATLSPSGYRIVVQDQGTGFDRSEVRDPLARENVSREGGRGLFLMETLVEQVRYEDGGRRVVLSGGDLVDEPLAAV